MRTPRGPVNLDASYKAQSWMFPRSRWCSSAQQRSLGKRLLIEVAAHVFFVGRSASDKPTGRQIDCMASCRQIKQLDRAAQPC